MKKQILVTLFSLIILLAFADARRIDIDGDFSDWGSALYTDNTGDIASGSVDFGQFSIANDADYLYLRFSWSPALDLDNGDYEVKLFIDRDNNASTGISVGGIGADIVWYFSDKWGKVYGTSAGTENIRWPEVDYIQSSIITSDEIECRFSRTATVGGDPLFPSNSFKVLLADETGNSLQDIVPNSGEILSYTFSEDATTPFTDISLAKDGTGTLRILSYNTQYDYDLNEDALWQTSRAAAASRILQALQPDIICFQEVYDHYEPDTAAKLEEIYPAPSGYSWNVANYYDCQVCSYYPITRDDNIYYSGYGNQGALIDLPDAEYEKDIYLFSCHLKALSGASNEARRQDEADMIMEFIRDDLKSGSTPLESGTPIFICGDMNFIDGTGPLNTLLTGDISDNASYGSDFTPDWDSSSFVELSISHAKNGSIFTQVPSQYYLRAKLDYFIYSDSVTDFQVGKKFIFDDLDYSASELSAISVQSGDCELTSDHLPVVLDLEVVNPVTGWQFY